MRSKKITDSETVILILQDEIRRSDEARYDHRLHAILLVAQGMSCRKAAEYLGDSARTVAYWVKQFEEEGLSGLVDNERPGRPSKLNENQIEIIESALRLNPFEIGLKANLWDGKLLSHFIYKEFKINLGVRQCQRLFRQLGFRYRKPRPTSSKADPKIQKEFKKNSKIS
jgi:transposase